MEMLNNLCLKCKEPGCNKDIIFSGEVKIPGNYFCVVNNESKDNALFLGIGITPTDTIKNSLVEEPVSTIVDLFQEQNNIHHKELFNLKNRVKHVQQKDIFYLTCEDGHTHPYEIILTV
jgi:hypothetical protein